MPELEHAEPAGAMGLEYSHSAAVFDEMVGPDGQFRPHWHDFVSQVEAIGLPELRQRWNEAQDTIRENGVTYNVYGDPRGMDRPWELDPIPLLISPSDSAAIEAGLDQRARLLDLILADVYGPQKLLTSGVLPSELVLGHPSFLRACHGLKVPGDRHLLLYGADVGRAPDGSFFVLADRTQSPSGAGYALENRIVLSRMLPEVFRDCRVQRLALFFRTLRETLRSIAPHNRENPRIVLLTPGPYNETYFEHAYLARYLGYTLVEGSDLTVRDNRVFMKLLGGLQPVDVIFRRLDDDFCDPLELKHDSFLGIPGLVQAVRAGNVAVANPLGSGLLESPALLAYMPALCRHLLGEPLVMPSVPTWWCGDPRSLDHVLANLSKMVIKPAFGVRRFDPIFGEELGPEQHRMLAETIRSHPLDYVGQEQLELSTAPVFTGNGLRPRHLVIRFLLTAAETGFTMMPGGLTRIAASADNLVVSMQKGGGSKDTWILTDGPVSTFSMLPTMLQPVELSRDGGDLPSRSADDLFWLGRYVERIEGMVRLLRGVLIRLTERAALAEVPELPSLLRALTYQTITYPGFLGQGASERIASPEKELLSIIGDVRRSGSLAATIQALHRISGRIRDRLSLDMWRILSTLDLPDVSLQDAVEGATNGRGAASGNGRDRDMSRRLSGLRDTLDRKIISVTAFAGLVADGMTRGQGWRFLDMGRRLERSLHIIGMLRTTLVWVTSPEAPLLEAILEIADSSMTYRRRYMSHLQTAPVLDLLLADEANPRSLAFQLAALVEHLERLPRNESAPTTGEEREIMLTACARLKAAQISKLAHDDGSGIRGGLESLLATLEYEVPVLSDSLSRNYFSLLQASRQYSRTREGERHGLSDQA